MRSCDPVRRAILLAALVCAALPAAAVPPERPPQPAPVEPAGEPVRLTGWFTDEWCGAGNANAKGAECARHCVGKGAPLVLYAEGRIYKLDEPGDGLDFVGREVIVKGRLMRNGHLRVESIRARRDDDSRLARSR